MPVIDDSAFARLINRHAVGDTLTLTVERRARALQLKVTLAARPAGS